MEKCLFKKKGHMGKAIVVIIQTREEIPIHYWGVNTGRFFLKSSV